MNQLDKKNHTNQNIILDRPFNKYRIFLSRFENKEFNVSDRLEIMCLVKGSVSLYLGNRVVKKLNKGDLYIINPNLCHEIENTKEENTILTLQIKNDYLRDHLKVSKDIHFSNILESQVENEILRLLGELYLMSFDLDWESVESDIRVKEILNLLPIATGEEVSITRLDGDRTTDIICRLAGEISNSYLYISSNNIRLSDLAEENNISYSYLSRHFKEVIGLSYMDYLLKLKMNKAVDLIINTDKKISEIAIASGFSNIKSFNISFQKIFQTTPTELRTSFKNINDIIRDSKLYNEKETQDFLDLVTTRGSKYTGCNFSKDHVIDFNSPILLKKEDWNTVIDINNILDVSKGFDNVEKILEDFYIKNLVVNIKIIDDEIYLVDKHKKLKLLNEMESNHIINIANRKGYRLVLVLNYEIPESLEKCKEKFNNEFKKAVTSKLEFISRIIGLSGLKNYIFGLRIYRLKDLIQNNMLDRVSYYIEGLTSIFDHKLGEGQYSWLLYLDDVSTLNDLAYIEKLMDGIKIPNKFIVSINYDHQYPSPKNAIDYYLNLLNDIKYLAEKKGADEVLLDFLYDVGKIPLKDQERMAYVSIFTLFFILKVKSKGYRVSSLDYIDSTKGVSLGASYLHNNMGLKTSNYYVTSFMKNLGDKLIYVDDGLFVTRDGDDLFVILYDNHENYYNYSRDKGNIVLLEDLEYVFRIKGLEGNYKIIELKVQEFHKRDDSVIDINKNYYTSVSDDEKELIQSKLTPSINMTFEEIHGDYVYKISRKLLDIHHIHFKKI